MKVSEAEAKSIIALVEKQGKPTQRMLKMADRLREDLKRKGK